MFMSGDKDSPKPSSKTSKELPLGEALRERYKEILDEPVPEKLRQLIDALKEKERQEADDEDCE